jgi:hypothetical protein
LRRNFFVETHRFGLGESGGDHNLDLRNGLVRDCSDQVVDIRGIETSRKDAQSTQAKSSIRERRKDRREFTSESRDLDPLGGRVLGEIEFADAERSHRLESGLQVEMSGVDLCDVGQEGSEVAMVLQAMGGEAVHDAIVVEVRAVVGVHGRSHGGA